MPRLAKRNTEHQGLILVLDNGEKRQLTSFDRIRLGYSKEVLQAWEESMIVALAGSKSDFCTECLRITLRTLTIRGVPGLPSLLKEASETRLYDSRYCALCSIISTGILIVCMIMECCAFVASSLHGQPQQETMHIILPLRVHYGPIPETIKLMPSTFDRNQYIWPRNFRSYKPKIIRNALAHCRKRHRECLNTSTTSARNLKVIHCRTRRILQAPLPCLYVALSYVWGSTNVHLQSNNHLPDSIELTIEDAIQVTQSLGFDYVWIDRYCIDQRGAHATEQIEQMHHIYQNAEVTLFAAAGKDANAGLAGVSNHLRDSQPHGTSGTIEVFGAARSLIQLLARSKWMSRGWSYQEAMFSRRRLYFTGEQVIFDCVVDQVYEGSSCHIKRLYREKKKHIPFGVEDLSTGLNIAIMQYSRRELSFETDALRGIQGILNAYDDMGYCSYWGVPEIDPDPELPFYIRTSPETQFVNGLYWVNVVDDEADLHTRRRLDFPSWSWAGWKGAVSFIYISVESQRTFDVKVWVERKDGSLVPWNQAREGLSKQSHIGPTPQFIHVEAHCLDLMLKSDETGHAHVRVGNDWVPIRNGPRASFQDLDSAQSSQVNEKTATAVLLRDPKLRQEEDGTHIMLLFVLILECKGDWWEGVGFVRFESCILPDEAWEKRKIRVG